jgi:hypothetical protein
MNLRAWFKRTKPSNTDPGVIATETATGHHDPAFVHRFFNGASTEALELAQKVIGGILEDRRKGV